jgi:hypothetical protein
MGSNLPRRFNWWYLYYGLAAIGLIIVLKYVQTGELPW